MKSCFAYIRVSTVKQGTHGVSLPEQRDAIAAYALRNNITITEWFEERVTAAKRGRTVFTSMLKRLEKREVSGLVIHKIDRGARNLKDWADLGELLDCGVTVHFVSDNLDMTSRGGRLSADIQAVVAADYIRNLREETKKGFYGRLKQGLYPMRAPLGYLDGGKGKPKLPNHTTAHLIRYAFEVYATGRYTLKTLRSDLTDKGLRNHGGRPLSINGISTLLNNPFYYGTIHIQKTNETFTGVHEPLISRSLFNRVQAALTGKTQRRAQKHRFTFSRLLTCTTCNYSLVGETHKGHTYYRCQTSTCPTTCLREEKIDENLRSLFRTIQITTDFKALLAAEAEEQRNNWETIETNRRDQAQMQLDRIKDRLDRLTDAYLDNLIDKVTFDERRQSLLASQQEVANATKTQRDATTTLNHFHEFLELASSVQLSYEMALGDDKRSLVQTVTSNRTVSGKDIAMTLQKPFQVLADATKHDCGDPRRDVSRIVKLLLAEFEAT